MLFEKRLKKNGVRCDAVVVKSVRTASSVGSTPAATRVGWQVLSEQIEAQQAAQAAADSDAKP